MMDYKLKDRVQRIKFAREAANVHRVHAQPALHPYPVGQHSFNMLTMLRILWPDCPTILIWAVVEHDIPERVTCDMSHPAKAAGLLNREAQNQMESHLNLEWSGQDALSFLDEYQRKWLNGLDMLEFFCFCKDQLMMGNRMYETKYNAVMHYMAKYAGNYPEKIIDMYHEIRMSSWATMPDIGGN